MDRKTEIGLKPKPERISGWNSGTEILYKCPKCNMSFAILESCNFCHNCGIKIDWSVVTMSNNFVGDIYHKQTYEKQKKIMDYIEGLNKTIPHGTPPLILKDFIPCQEIEFVKLLQETNNER